MVNILLSVSVALSLVAVLTSLLLMTLILSKKLRPDEPMSFYLLGSGFSLVLCSVLCLAALSLL
jgi:hypothetical protein